MNKREFIKKAIDSSNAFISTSSEATTVNPAMWDRKLRDFEEQSLIMTNLSESYDFREPGRDLTITVDDAPVAAAALTETVDVPITSFTTRQVTYTPTEQGAAYQLTRKEAVRAFFDVAERMVRKLGYMMALRKDNLAYSVALSGAGNEVVANSVAQTALATTDTLNYAAITSAISENEADYYIDNKYLVISHKQKQQLLNLGTINKANEFGTRDAIQKGLVGELFGLQVFATHSVTTSTQASGEDYSVAMVMAVSGSGEGALGYAIKRDPMIEREYHARGRYWDIVAHEEYDFQVLHPNALCKVITYSG